LHKSGYVTSVVTLSDSVVYRQQRETSVIYCFFNHARTQCTTRGPEHSTWHIVGYLLLVHRPCDFTFTLFKGLIPARLLFIPDYCPINHALMQPSFVINQKLLRLFAHYRVD